MIHTAGIKRVCIIPYDQMANGFYTTNVKNKTKNDNINYKVLTHHNNMTNVLAFGQTLSATFTAST